MSSWNNIGSRTITLLWSDLLGWLCKFLCWELVTIKGLGPCEVLVRGPVQETIFRLMGELVIMWWGNMLPLQVMTFRNNYCSLFILNSLVIFLSIQLDSLGCYLKTEGFPSHLFILVSFCQFNILMKVVEIYVHEFFCWKKYNILTYIWDVVMT